MHGVTVPPPPVQGVFGRETLLQEIVRLLTPEPTGQSHVHPLALWGMGGIGKTTLATLIGHDPRVQSLFSDGVLWTAVGPETKAIRPRLEGLGRMMHIDLRPEFDEAACVDRLRSELSSQKALLIIDDVWSVAYGNHFRNIAGPRCRTLITTRDAIVAYGLATREGTLQVDVLSEHAALGLLRRLAPEAVRADEEAAKRLCEQLGYLPLGLTLAGRLLANESDVPAHLRQVMGELLEGRGARLDLPADEGRPGLREGQRVFLSDILGMSVERLSDREQQCFAMLSRFGAEPLHWTVEDAAAVWDCSEQEAAATVSRLFQRALVGGRGEQYWLHALLCDYATELCKRSGL